MTGLPAQTAAELPGVLKTLTGNVDTRRPRHPHGRRDGGRWVRVVVARWFCEGMKETPGGYVHLSQSESPSLTCILAAP